VQRELGHLERPKPCVPELGAVFRGQNLVSPNCRPPVVARTLCSKLGSICRPESPEPYIPEFEAIRRGQNHVYLNLRPSVEARVTASRQRTRMVFMLMMIAVFVCTGVRFLKIEKSYFWSLYA
jgi:hypothetical protein